MGSSVSSGGKSSEACPSDCSGCDASKTVSISGFTGTYAGMNGNWTITRSGCEWSTSGGLYVDCFDGYVIRLLCSGSLWYLFLELESWRADCGCSDSFEGIRINLDDCPPTGAYAMSRSTGGSDCDVVPTVSVS